MEASLRVASARLFKWCYRKPFGICSYKNVTGAAVKEEVAELLGVFNNDIKAGGSVPVFRRALLFPTRIALQDDIGIYTYAGLHQAAAVLCKEIAAELAGDTERTIAYLCSNDASHVIVQWAIWMSGNIAVPLSALHPPEMMKYFITDSGASVLICSQEYEKLLTPLSLEVSRPLLVTSRHNEITAQLYQPNTTLLKPKLEDMSDVGRSNAFYGNSDALIIYTSGTTSKPKGVVWTHNMLSSQIAALHTAWRYSASDVVLHMLPLHHIHGQLNSLNASLAAGARIRMVRSFVSHTVWARLLGMGEREEVRPTALHGVPAMFARLAADHEAMFAGGRTQPYVRAALSRLRLLCAGSAPLPAKLFHKWEEIAGTRLLERYGMSETGMALSNPYRPVEARTVGCVGRPLPGVSARIAAVKEDGALDPLITVETPDVTTEISLNQLGLMSPKELFEEETDAYDWKPSIIIEHKKDKDGTYQGELLLKGPGVFTRYLNRAPKLDSADFTSDGWFRTGDTAIFADNKFKILGRTSVDIIKTGGYKVSALQVESAILDHPSVADVAVLGVEDDSYGEIVAAVVALKPKAKLTLKELKDEAGKKLAPYQLPKTLFIVGEMPRNAMGKLDKKEIRRLYADKLTMKKFKP